MQACVFGRAADEARELVELITAAEISQNKSRLANAERRVDSKPRLDLVSYAEVIAHTVGRVFALGIVGFSSSPRNRCGVR
jgi:hypothetical protein